MSDLEFKHHVSEIPAGENVPHGLQRTVTAETTHFPDVQSAAAQYADATNWMSKIGSSVAAKASNAIANKMGTDLGKNPQGDLGIPLTEFDEAVQKSYRTQAQATLGLQANKLITDANIEMAKAPRLSPGLIAKTNQSISIGLQNIFKHAPNEVRPHLEYQYGSIQLNQFEQLNHRMISEQREDQKNNTIYASNINSESAYTLAIGGNYKAAQEAVKATEEANQSAVQMRTITPTMAKTNVDTARKSYLNGKYIREYENANTHGKGEEYLKSIADKKPNDLSDADYIDVTNNLMAYVNHQNALRSEDEQLRLAKFQVSLAKDPLGITGSQIQDLKENVSALAFEKAQLNYINAIKSYNNDQNNISNAINSWNDPNAFARLGEKAIDKGFDLLTNKYIQQRQDQGVAVTQDEAEVQVAASAAGKVPVFVNTLRNKLNSANPVMMDSAARQIDELYSMNASHALAGLSDQDKAIFSQYKSLRDGLPPEEAAKIAIQNANQDPDTQKMNKEKWAAYVKNATAGLIYGSTSPTKWALKQVDLNPDEFLNPGIANVYGNMILQKYAAFFQMTNGDKDNALKLTKQEVKENYGYTGVNGGKIKTLHPIEKVLGYEENSDVVPFIQEDVAATLNKSFMPLKEAFNKGESNVYWDIVPIEMKNKAFFGHHYEPIKVKRYTKTSNGTKTDTYDVVLIGNSFNWDISLSTDSGIRPLIQMAPYLGIHTYTPNKKSIDEKFIKQYGIK